MSILKFQEFYLLNKILQADTNYQPLIYALQNYRQQGQQTANNADTKTVKKAMIEEESEEESEEEDDEEEEEYYEEVQSLSSAVFQFPSIITSITLSYISATEIQARTPNIGAIWTSTLREQQD